MQAGIGKRLAHCREKPYALLTDWVPDLDAVDDDMRHEVARHLALVATVGYYPQDERLLFRFGVEHVQSLVRRMNAVGLDPARPYFVVHPGASAASRRYPAAAPPNWRPGRAVAPRSTPEAQANMRLSSGRAPACKSRRCRWPANSNSANWRR